MTKSTFISEYSSLKVKKETMTDLKNIQQAFELSYGKSFSADELIKQLIAAVEDGDPSVWEAYCIINQKQQEIKEAVEKLNIKKQ